ncbi:MAG: hypothetical protein B6244_01865 [Candidatus Cloacimonetes bacterium 4572_55]|nr:MAG: hypothetical protein B6244_01865 [Candidatus Cloacimonetes bacterium 4572_55]
MSLNPFSWYKRKKFAVTESPFISPSDDKSMQDKVPFNICLYELEKKLIRLEISIRRLKDDPQALRAFSYQLKGLTEEIEQELNPDIISNFENYIQIIKKLKNLSYQLENGLQQKNQLKGIMEGLINDVSELLGRHGDLAIW